MEQRHSDITKILASNRKLTLLCGLQAVLLAVLALAGWKSQSNELTLRRLAIVDSWGHERVILRGGEDGLGVVLMDSSGHTRCGLTVDNNLPGLRMYNERDKALAGLVINPTGPNLDFLNPDGSYIERFPSARVVRH